ncbi:MAG: hypothetical protein HC888_00790 [Candidatus Competibacteraceae bacterium]|nr:hypothetical protein [Candidatus Competibacteraceae bacterium]
MFEDFLKHFEILVEAAKDYSLSDVFESNENILEALSGVNRYLADVWAGIKNIVFMPPGLELPNSGDPVADAKKAIAMLRSGQGVLSMSMAGRPVETLPPWAVPIVANIMKIVWDMIFKSTQR